MISNEPHFELTETNISGKHARLARLGQQPHLWRFIRAGSSILAIVIVGTLIARPYIANLLPQPHMLTQVNSSALFRFFIQTNVSYGTLTVNGIAVATKPNDMTMPFFLTQDKIVIQLTAEPYQPITCTITALNEAQLPNLSRCGSGGNINGVTAINMKFSVSDLPTATRQQLFAYLPTAFDEINHSQALVLAQSHYATGNSTIFPNVAITSQPLMARLHVAIGTASTHFIGCQELLCPMKIGDNTTVTEPAYSVFQVPVHFTWQFFQKSGQLVATYPVPNGNIPNTYPSYVSIAVHLSADRGWYSVVPPSQIPLALQISAELCNKAENIVYIQGYKSGSVGLPTMSGCLMYLTNSASNGSLMNSDPINDTHNAWFLVHFGAVLAVSEPAHTLAPILAWATPQEVNEILAASLK